MLEDTGGLIESTVKAVGGQGVLDWAHGVRDWVVDRVGGRVAERELGETDDPRQLLHGDPEAITAAAEHLGRLAGGFNSVGEGMRRLEPDGWRGEAAEKFRQAYTPQPRAWFTAEGAADQASRALDGFAHTVAWARRQAEDALAVYQDGVNRTRRAEAAYQRETDAYNSEAEAYNQALAAGADPGARPSPPGPFFDPGAGQQQRAREMLTRAREQRDAQAASALRAVSGATELAPPTLAAGRRAVTEAKNMLGMVATEYLHFEGGLAKGVGDMVRFVREIDPYDPYNITHPAAWIDTVGTTTAALAHADLHPTELAQGLVGTGWSTDPAESLGKLTANIATTAIADGGGEAAATASAAARASAATARQTSERAVEHAAEHAADHGAGASAVTRAPTKSLAAEHPTTPTPSTTADQPASQRPSPQANPEPPTLEPHEPSREPTPGQPAQPSAGGPPEPHPPAAPARGEHGPPEPALPAAPHQLPNPLTPANLPVHPPANLQAALSRLSAGEQLSDIERALAGLDHIDTTAFTPSTPASTLAQVHTPSTPATTHPTLVTSAAHPPTGDLNQALHQAEDELAAFGTRNPGQIRASPDTPDTQPHPDTGPTRHDFTPPTGTDTPPVIPSRNETPHDETQPHNPTQDLSPDIGTVDTNTHYSPPPPLHRDIPLPERKQLRSKYEGEDDLYNPDQIYYPAACHYFPPDVLEEHRLFIRDGKMYRADDGNLFDTRFAYVSETSNLPSAIFVMDEHGNFYASGVYSTGAGRHHSSFLSGGPVAGAGEIAAEAGVPFYINRNSGHYHPGLELHQQVREILKEQGVDVDRIQFDDRRWLWY